MKHHMRKRQQIDIAGLGEEYSFTHLLAADSLNGGKDLIVVVTIGLKDSTFGFVQRHTIRYQVIDNRKEVGVFFDLNEAIDLYNQI